MARELDDYYQQTQRNRNQSEEHGEQDRGRRPISRHSRYVEAEMDLGPAINDIVEPGTGEIMGQQHGTYYDNNHLELSRETAYVNLDELVSSTIQQAGNRMDSAITGTFSGQTEYLNDETAFVSTINETLHELSEEALNRFRNNESPADSMLNSPSRIPSNSRLGTPPHYASTPVRTLNVTREEMQPLLQRDQASEPQNDFDIIVEQNNSSSQTHMTTRFQEQHTGRPRAMRPREYMEGLERLAQQGRPSILSPAHFMLSYSQYEANQAEREESNHRSTGTSTVHYVRELSDDELDGNGDPQTRLPRNRAYRAPDTFPHLKEDHNGEQWTVLMHAYRNLDPNGDRREVCMDDDVVLQDEVGR